MGQPAKSYRLRKGQQPQCKPGELHRQFKIALPCPHCERIRTYACGCHTGVTNTNGCRVGAVIGDCTEYHKKHRALRSVCDCGRTPCLPGQRVCVWCFDEEEALGDAMYGVGYVGVEPIRED